MSKKSNKKKAAKTKQQPTNELWVVKIGADLYLSITGEVCKNIKNTCLYKNKDTAQFHLETQTCERNNHWFDSEDFLNGGTGDTGLEMKIVKVVPTYKEVP